MNSKQTIITEQCGARWVICRGNAGGARAYWCQLVDGCSAAKQGVFGFYAESIEAACEALAN